MIELITNRTQYHVSLLNRLRKKPWSSMTASEQAAWNGEAALGAYNYTDLNRVETAVRELAAELGLNLTTKTDWTLWDIPVASEMERYLGNIVAIRDACPGDVVFPTLPVSMNGLTFEGANNIEIVLQMVNEELNKIPSGDESEYSSILGEFVLGKSVLGENEPGEPDTPDIPDEPEIPTTADYIRSGEIFSGEVL